MSKKTVSFAMPASARRGRKPEPTALKAPSAPHAAAGDFAGSRPDDWVSHRHVAAGLSLADDALAPPPVLLDLSAERSLMEVFSLSFSMPFALGWFWWINAFAGRGRL